MFYQSNKIKFDDKILNIAISHIERTKKEKSKKKTKNFSWIYKLVYHTNNYWNVKQKRNRNYAVFL